MYMEVGSKKLRSGNGTRNKYSNTSPQTFDSPMASAKSLTFSDERGLVKMLAVMSLVRQ